MSTISRICTYSCFKNAWSESFYRIFNSLKIKWKTQREMDNLEDLKENGFRLSLPRQMTQEDGLENEDIANPSVRVETVVTTVKNFATEKFVFEMDLPHLILSGVNEDEKGVPLYKTSTMDMDSVIRRLVHTALENSGSILRVDDQLILDVAHKLSCGILQQHNALEESQLVYRLVPAIALDRCVGAVVAFGLGLLVMHNSQDHKKRMLFHGFAQDIHTQQILIKSVSASLVTHINMDAEKTNEISV